MTKMPAPKLTRKELIDLLGAEYREMFRAASGYDIEQVWRGGRRVLEWAVVVYYLQLNYLKNNVNRVPS